MLPSLVVDMLGRDKFEVIRNHCEEQDLVHEENFPKQGDIIFGLDDLGWDSHIV